MPLRSFLFVFAFFVLAFSVFAQEADEAAQEKLRRETALLEQILVEAKNLRLPENRASVYAKVGQQLWKSDEKRARALFQTAFNDLIQAQNQAETEKGNQNFLNNLVYGQSPRWEILQMVANLDAEIALDQMVKTRPGKLARALANLNGDYQTRSSQYARGELQNEQRIIAQAAEQNPQRVVKLLRESLKKDVNYETLNLLKRIHQKDPETANQLAETVAQRLLDAKLEENNQDTGLIQQFLSEVGREPTKENPSITISEAMIRRLAEKIVKYTLRPNSSSYISDNSGFKIIEKFFPADALEMKRRHEKAQNQHQTEQSREYSKLMNANVTGEELLRQAEKFPASYRRELYRRAAEKTAQSGNVAAAQSILTDNLLEDELEQYLSQFNSNLARQAISESKYEEAAVFIDQITEQNQRLQMLVSLATSLYQKNPQENQSPAAAILGQARSILSETPEKIGEMNLLLNLASGYANVEMPNAAFSLLETLISPLNELSESSAVVAKYSDHGNFRHGEFPVIHGNGGLPVYNLASVLQRLKTKDHDRAIRFTNGFSRLDARISLQLQLLQLGVGDLPINGFIYNISFGGGPRRNRPF